MVYHYLQQLPSAGKKGLYQIKNPDKGIDMFWWFVSDIMTRDKNKARHKQLISNCYKYHWKKLTKIIIIAIKSTYSFW